MLKISSVKGSSLGLLWIIASKHPLLHGHIHLNNVCILYAEWWQEKYAQKNENTLYKASNVHNLKGLHKAFPKNPRKNL